MSHFVSICSGKRDRTGNEGAKTIFLHFALTINIPNMMKVFLLHPTTRIRNSSIVCNPHPRHKKSGLLLLLLYFSNMVSRIFPKLLAVLLTGHNFNISLKFSDFLMDTGGVGYTTWTPKGCARWIVKIKTMCASIFKLYFCMGCANDSPALAKARRQKLERKFRRWRKFLKQKKWAKEQWPQANLLLQCGLMIMMMMMMMIALQ